MGHAPSWWPAAIGGDGYLALPNSTTDVAFWRDVCATYCVRRHGADVELVYVDLRPGLVYGDDAANPSGCECYAYYADASSGAASHVAPSDRNALQFLRASGAALVNNYVDGAGRRFRQYANLYAVHRKEWEGHFILTQQSTMYYQRAAEAGFLRPSIDAASLVAPPVDNVAHRDACLEQCAQLADAALVRSALYQPDSRRCHCVAHPALALSTTGCSRRSATRRCTGTGTTTCSSAAASRAARTAHRLLEGRRHRRRASPSARGWCSATAASSSAATRATRRRRSTSTAARRATRARPARSR